MLPTRMRPRPPILDRHDPIDIQERASTGASRDGRAISPKPSTTPARISAKKIPVVEEQLKVGKRDVERGGVRIRSYVTAH